MSSILIAGFANTTDIDRQGDKITLEAWENGLEQFIFNPVMLFQHSQRDVIGRVTKASVGKVSDFAGEGLFIEGEIFDTEENQRHLIPAIKQGMPRAFSVGFKLPRSQKGELPIELIDDVWHVKELELLEISIVSVPANPTSLFRLDTPENRQKRNRVSV